MPEIKDYLENVNTLCITGHVRPDGDEGEQHRNKDQDNYRQNHY